MKNLNRLLLSVILVGAVSMSSSGFAKTAKDCRAEWRADKVGMQSRGVTEKAYIDQCKGGADPTATAPSPKPSAITPSVAPKQPRSSSSGKTAKDCIAEWRADKAGMQARGVTQKTYVEQCKAGITAPAASAPTVKPTAVPAPAQASPSRTETRPSPVPQRTAPPTTAAPTPAPAPQSSAARGSATLEVGQFADESSAKARCPTDTVVWVNLSSKVYHFAGTKSYGTTKRGAYMCEKEAIAAEDRASKTEKHP